MKYNIGENFFILKDCDLSVEYELLSEILFLAKMIGLEVVYSTSNKNKDSIKSHDMITFKNQKTSFYLTLTYIEENKSFVEFCINPLDSFVTNLLIDDIETTTFRHSNYFYSTEKKEKISNILNIALNVLKKI